jgi:hypothetical protein
MFQQFRNHRNDEVVLRLSEHEIEVKRQMLASYRTQRVLTSIFHLHTERFRPALQEREKECTWANYAFENRRRGLKATLFLEKVEELNRSALASDRSINNESETKPSNS